MGENDPHERQEQMCLCYLVKKIRKKINITETEMKKVHNVLKTTLKISCSFQILVQQNSLKN